MLLAGSTIPSTPSGTWPIARRAEDPVAEAYAMVILVESRLAQQTDVARAFARSVRTVRRHQGRYAQGGMAALAASPSGPAWCGPITANKIAEIFGTRLHRRHRGKLATVIDQIEHGHHVFRTYFKSAFLKQYEKFSTFLRNELCSNNLTDFGLKKGLDHLDAVRQTFQAITDRFAGYQAQWLNVHDCRYQC
jgi:hypothetical protein